MNSSNISGCDCSQIRMCGFLNYDPNLSFMQLNLPQNIFVILCYNSVNIQMTEANIQVVIRFRPLLPFEDEECWLINENNKTVSSMVSQKLAEKIQTKFKKKTAEENLNHINYQYQQIVKQSTKSEQIYNDFCFDIISESLQGINGTICAYGQTCSGKTYSINGTEDNPGILPHALRHIFQQTSKSQLVYKISVSYIEIYNQSVNDLLEPTMTNLKIQQDQKWGIQVKASKKVVKTLTETLNLLNKGEGHRSYKKKLNHDHSSRSHTIFRIYIESHNDTLVKSKLLYKYSVLNIVDLAGSQRLSKTQENMPQTGSINKSLFMLSNVITKLVQKQPHIPYRDSKLTRILENSLGGNSSTLILCCLSPSLSSFQQTLSTLRFANAVKKVKNIKKQNRQEGEMIHLQSQIKRLKEQYSKLELKYKTLQKQYQNLKIQNQLNKRLFNSSKDDRVRQKTKTAEQALILLDDYDSNMIKFISGIGVPSEELNRANQKYKQQKLVLCSNFIKQITKDKKIVCSEIKGGLLESKKFIQKQQKQFLRLLTKSKIKQLKQSQNYLNPEQFQTLQRYYSLLFQNLQKLKIGSQQYTGILWGSNKDFRLGKPNETSTSANQIQFKISQLSLGAHHTLAISKGCVYGWGKNNYNQINQSASINQKQLQNICIPTKINFQNKIISIAAGWGHSLVLDQNGRIFSWGFGEEGQLGHGNNNSLTLPTMISNIFGTKSIFAGHSHSAFIDHEGDFYTFGCNVDYRLMHDSLGNSPSLAFKKVKQASLGITHTCIISESGQLYGGGDGSYGQLGVMKGNGYEAYPKSKRFDEEKSTSCCIVQEIQGFENKFPDKVSCGQHFTIVLTKNKKVYTFGKGSYYRLGTGNLCNVSQPFQILKGQCIKQIFGGSRHCLAVSDGGEIYSWGFNMYNQCSGESQQDVKVPTKISEFKDMKTEVVRAGFFHSGLLFKTK